MIAAGTTTTAPDLAWVDEFIARVRPYIRVREEDNLLIRMPNQAHRLNATGTRVLAFLLEGGTVAGLAAGLDGDPGKLAEVALFLREIRRCLDGSLTEFALSEAVEVRPFALGFSSLPVLAEVALTPRCNLRCAFCYYGCPGGRGGAARPGGPERATEMTRDELERVFEVIAGDARTPSLSFTGGEPTLRRDLPELIAGAREAGLRVNLITNGTLVTEELADRLAAAGLASAQVSLEGASADTHDFITGTPGAFAKALAAVERFRERGVTVHTNTTLNRLNLDDAADMPWLVAERLGLERFSMNMVIPTGTAALAGERLLVRYSETGPAVERVLAASQEWGVEFMWYSPTPVCIFNPITEGLGNKGCAACDGLLSVDCNGDVLPCSSWSEPVGNVLNEPFKEIWSSGRSRHIREKAEAPQGCAACDSFAVCQGACPLYWRHFGYGELARTRGSRTDLTRDTLTALKG